MVEPLLGLCRRASPLIVQLTGFRVAANRVACTIDPAVRVIFAVAMNAPLSPGRGSHPVLEAGPAFASLPT